MKERRMTRNTFNISCFQTQALVGLTFTMSTLKTHKQRKTEQRILERQHEVYSITHFTTDSYILRGPFFVLFKPISFQVLKRSSEQWDVHRVSTWMHTPIFFWCTYVHCVYIILIIIIISYMSKIYILRAWWSNGVDLLPKIRLGLVKSYNNP